MNINLNDFNKWAENLEPAILKLFGHSAKTYYQVMQEEDPNFDKTTALPRAYIKAFSELLKIYKNTNVNSRKKTVKGNIIYFDFKEKKLSK